MRLQVNVQSLEEVIKYYLKTTTDRAEEAQSKAKVSHMTLSRALQMKAALHVGMPRARPSWTKCSYAEHCEALALHSTSLHWHPFGRRCRPRGIVRGRVITEAVGTSQAGYNWAAQRPTLSGRSGMLSAKDQKHCQGCSCLVAC